MMILFEIILIGALVALQFFVFMHVHEKINRFKHFFPLSFKGIEIRKFPIQKNILGDSDQFDKYLDTLPETIIVKDPADDVEEIELLKLQPNLKKRHPQFDEVIKSTNAYLCKNKGAAADFGILKDICERHSQQADNEIGNLINVPLYIGLGGTFVGIIVGLSGIDFSATTEGATTTISSSSINQLLNGVIAAMIASLIGLAFTVINAAWFYKPAAYKNDSDKNHYYDFLQRELLPFLNIGVSRSLGSFREVLNHFIRKFGENMDDYKDSGALLNENLKSQHLVLEEINKLSLTRTATKIAEIFTELRDSSEHLERFISYQKTLNNYVDKTEHVSSEVKSIIESFREFSMNLKSITNQTVSTLDLQKQFKDSLEKHFPTISDHRDIWRRQVDELNTDIKGVYQELINHFTLTTKLIEDFIGNNTNFFKGINEIQNGVKIFVENSVAQKEEFILLKDGVNGLRSDFREYQKQTIETNIQLIDAIKDLKTVMNRIETPIER